MGHIISLHEDPHREVETLLPWYLAGGLDADEHARVEAHLGVCQACQVELAFDRRLRAEVAAVPVEVEHDWARLNRRLETRPSRPVRGPDPLARIPPAKGVPIKTPMPRCWASSRTSRPVSSIR